jgi:ABC-type transport system substrate-binding protein
MKIEGGKDPMKKRLTALLLSLMMVFTLASCASKTATNSTTGDAASDASSTATAIPVASSEPTYGGSVTLYYPKFYNYFDPAIQADYAYDFWNESLWAMDWANKDYGFTTEGTSAQYMAGQIADTWVAAPDLSYLDVTIRDDVYFQDKAPINGRQLTADDIVYSYSRLLGLNGMTAVESEFDWKGTLSAVIGVEKTGDYTVRFTFGTVTSKGPGGDTVGYAQSSIDTLMTTKVNITSHEWDDLSADQQTWQNAYGTGPYTLTDYVAGQSMTLTKNDNYYDYDEKYPDNKLPYIDEIKLVYISDSANVLSQFLTGNLDWFGEKSVDVLNSSELSTLESKDVGNEYTYSTGPAGIGLKCSQAPFSDKNVRIAMQKAIDIQTINESYLGVSGTAQIPGLWDNTSDWSASSEWTDRLASEYSYDPDAAKQMLSDAGYPNGFEFTIALDPLQDVTLYELVKDYLSKVGITMTIETYSDVMAQSFVVTDATNPSQFNMNCGYFSSIMQAQIMTCTGGFGYGLFTGNTDYENLITQMSTASDASSIADLAKQADTIFAENHWILACSGVKTVHEYMSSRIGGYDGQKVYVDSNMRTIFARLWAAQ